MGILKSKISGYVRSFLGIQETSSYKPPEKKFDKSAIPPGRVSVANDTNDLLSVLQGNKEMVAPSFRTELIPLIRDLYKVNPDVSIAVSDMFKLGNTKHSISFPYNTDKEAVEMRKHLDRVSKDWLSYTAGTFGLVNKLMTQMLVSGVMSIEAVPKQDLSGISNIVFVNPEDVVFEREANGKYAPYQRNKKWSDGIKKPLIKLNPLTYVYVSMYNDTDEPYGIPPFMSAIDSLKTQADMKVNIKHMMELLGIYGFFEAKMAKPDIVGGESIEKYRSRLNSTLAKMKQNVKDGLKDGVVVGYIDEHEFKLNSTTKDLNNVNKPWDMNQQSVANGLGVSGSIIGTANNTSSEGGISIMFSKMISQLANIQEFAVYVLQFVYELELRLAGFNSKGVKVKFYPSTITDDVKIQQGKEYKIRNLGALYERGIIGQYDFAFEMGYEEPDQEKPRVDLGSLPNASDAAKKQQREADKDKSDRTQRDKEKPVPKRKDGQTKER